MLLLLLPACARRGIRRAPVDSSADWARSIQPERRVIPVPPWQVWSKDSFGNRDLAEGDLRVDEGKLNAGIEHYRSAYMSDVSSLVRSEALLRQCGTLLKMGRSKEVLNVVSASAREQGTDIEAIDPGLALIVAFAYQHQRDINQSLAWFGVVHRAAKRRRGLALKAQTEAERLVRGLVLREFDVYQETWASDDFIGTIFARERLRRTHGGTTEVANYDELFRAETYTWGEVEGGVRESDLETDSTIPGHDEEETIVGVLLPLSGRFRQHGERVREGIELAIEDLLIQGKKVKLVFADTEGDAEIAAAKYLQLVEREKVSFVFGPLLVKTTKSVAAQSTLVGVPFLTFTKREGIPEIGPTVFRLGATAENQAVELSSYAIGSLQLRRFATLFPANDTGRELARAFHREVARRQGVILREVSFLSHDENSFLKALNVFENDPPQAIFIADSLENARPFLEALGNSALTDVVLLGPASWDDPVALRGYGRLIEGAVYVTPFFVDSSSPEVEAFVNSYTERFSHKPGLLSAQAYDAAQLMMSVLAPEYQSPAILIKNLESADTFYGVTGNLSVHRNGEIARRMSIVRLVDGEPVEVFSRGILTGFVTDDEGRKIGMVER